MFVDPDVLQPLDGCGRQPAARARAAGAPHAADARQDVSLGQTAVAHDAPTAVAALQIGGRGQKLGNFRFERLSQKLAGAIAPYFPQNPRTGHGFQRYQRSPGASPEMFIHAIVSQVPLAPWLRSTTPTLLAQKGHRRSLGPLIGVSACQALSKAIGPPSALAQCSRPVTLPTDAAGCAAVRPWAKSVARGAVAADVREID